MSACQCLTCRSVPFHSLLTTVRFANNIADHSYMSFLLDNSCDLIKSSFAAVEGAG